MPTTTYTVVCRTRNNYLHTENGIYRHIIHDCGHKHRSIEAAHACMKGLKGTTLWISANVETFAADQLRDGEIVELTGPRW